MRDLAFDIRARDRTQQAFDAAGRNARAFGKAVDQAGAGAMSSARATDRMTQAVDRYAGAVRRASSANQMWQRNNLRLQLFDVGQMLALGQNPMMTALQQGPQIAQIWGPNEGGVGRAFRETGKMITGVLTKFPLLTAASVAAGVAFAGIAYEINRSGEASVSFGDVALASLQVVRDGIWNFLQPAVAAIAPWFATAWGMVGSGTKTVANTIINSFQATAIDVEATVMALPDAFVVAGEAAANGFLSGIDWMVREAISLINGLLTDINGLARGAGLDDVVGLLDMPKSGRWSIDLGAAEAEGRLEALLERRNKAVSDIMASDPLGEFFDAVKTQAIANSLGEIETKAGAAGNALKKAANDNKDPWNSLTKELEKMNGALNQAGQSAGGILQGLAKGTLDWRDALMQAAQVALKLINDMNLARGGSGLFGGGFLQGLIGGLFGVSFHGGGNVGSGGNVVQFPTGAPFAGTFHKGGNFGGRRAQHDEVMALVKRRENIFTEANTSRVARALEGGDGGCGGIQQVDVVVRGVFVDDNGKIKAYVQNVSQRTAAQAEARAIDTVKRSMQGWNVQIAQDGAVT